MNIMSSAVKEFSVVASHLPLTMAEIKVLSSLESAKEKLKQNGFPFEDPTWNDVRNDCGLLLPELIALKNEVAGTTPNSVYSILLFVDSYSNLFEVRRLQPTSQWNL